MKLGALGLPAYRTFSLEEIEEATGNFDSSAFMGEGSYGQVRKISLKHMPRPRTGKSLMFHGRIQVLNFLPYASITRFMFGLFMISDVQRAA